MLRRLLVLIAALCLLPLAAASLGQTAGAEAPSVSAGEANKPAKPKKPKYKVTIRQTEHGIPHITGRNFRDLGFGSGYMTADSSACTLLDTLVTGRGQRSLWFGAEARYDDQVTLEASNLQVDAFVTDLRNRKVVEKLLADKVNGPGKQARAMVKGFVAGSNKWIRKNKVTDPECRNAPYLANNAAGLGKVTALDLWYGVYMANMLASSGVFLKEIVDADPPSPDDPEVPALPLSAADVSDAQRDQILAGLGRDPNRQFGSNATAVGGAKTTTKRGMLLGNPHFPWRGRYHFTQQHLTIPGKYDIAGASLIGSPVVNIGWNKNVAWSHTVSTAYRFTPYEYHLFPGDPTTIVTDAGPQALEHREVSVKVLQDDGTVDTVTEDLWRTDEGYVLEASAVLMLWTPASVWALRDANAEHLRTIDVFLEMAKAKNVRDLIRRQDKAAGMPWVNTTAADRFGNVVYADHSVVPNVSNAMAQQCMTAVGQVLYGLAGLPGLDGTFADSSCAWGTDSDATRPGIFGPANLPELFTRNWVMNANDSYWTPNTTDRLEGYARIIGCEDCERTMRTRMVSQYVVDRLASNGGAGLESPLTFARHEHENRVRAAEVMREGGDLDTLCDATGETEACAVLAAWDGHSSKTSVGTHIFEEFIKRAPADLLWEVPFDAADPFNTPRDLDETNADVQAALADAIAYLNDQGVDMDAAWGSLQVAGDRGASPIPLGGGLGDIAGNANALSSSNPKQNAGHFRPITYGSSHIQAIAFLDKGRVKARTILTYSQYENPKSRWSQDQTKLFSDEKWVAFPWTDRQIKRQLVREFVLVGR